jgi:cold shock CspA family protein
MSLPRGGPRAPVTGVVIEFDDRRGLGVVLADDGRRLGFHCTAIADGTRTVAVGARVVFWVAPAHLGRYEARNVSVLPT